MSGTWVLDQLPSVGLCVWGFLVHWQTGNRRRIGWAMGVVGQVAWFAFALWLRQYGLIIGCLIYGSVYLRNWLKWRREE